MLAQVGRYSMDFYMDEAKRVVDAHVLDPVHPMFLYFAHQEQHVPLQVLHSVGGGVVYVVHVVHGVSCMVCGVWCMAYDVCMVR
jgi:hypothetical protein